MGDATAIGGEVQAEVDELAELAPIGAATVGQGAFSGGVARPGRPEQEPPATRPKGKP